MGIRLSIALFFLIAVLESSTAVAPPLPQNDILKQDLIGFLEGANAFTTVSPSHPLFALRTFPLAATMAYLLMENEPALMARCYPGLSTFVGQLLAADNLTDEGLVRGMPGPAEGRGGRISPGFNVLADLELYSLHLIAWKTGAYEDAIELLARSRRLSDSITRSFYDPSRRLFFPLDGSGAFVTAHSPGQLLPLVTDMSLGSSAHARIAAAFFEESMEPPALKPNPADETDPWKEPFMRCTVLTLLSTTLDRESELFSVLRASADSAAAGADSGQAAWCAFWREEPSLRRHLFPRWRAISCLVNLTLLLERESLLQEKELSALRSGVDSLVTALSVQSMNLDSYIEATGTTNRLLTRVSRISQLIDSKKERWRIINEGKWLRLSPRIKRIIAEGWATSLSELARAKSDLSAELERDRGIALRLELPEKPVVVGKRVEYSVTLQVSRDTLAASRFYLQIGDTRWKMMEAEQSAVLTPGGAPLRYENALPLAPTVEPGIMTLPVFIDFFAGGRRVEIHRVESIVLAKEFDTAFNLPEGRRIREKPVPIDIVLTYRPDHDIQGTIEGAFLRELTSTPSLPARFLARENSEYTKLTLMVTPKGPISPGRYPFSLTVALDGKPMALLEENLVRPFRWLHIGPLSKADDALRNALEFQSDLFKAYAVADGRRLRWQEVPPGAIDGEGTLRAERLYGTASDRCMLLYSVVDAPVRMKLAWKLQTDNAFSLWVNSELIVSGGEVRTGTTSGPVALRKGPNSFLIAACWEEAPGGISFELSDENGLPAAGLSNELDTIVDGYERLGAKETDTKREIPPEVQVHDVVITYANPDANEVSIIGSFNNWEPGVTQMRREGKSRWTATLPLRPGKYQYKLLVNRKSKIADPANKVTEPDGFGGFNSVLEVR